MPIREREEALFEEWQCAIGMPFVPDGVVDSKPYSSSSRRLLYVLKEANDYDKDLRSFVRKGAQGATWNNLTRWTKTVHALPNTLDWSKLEYVTLKQRIETLKSIAFMNINKHGGGAQANQKELGKIAERDQGFIRKQIQIYDADYMVCCGTGDLVKPILPDKGLKDYRTDRGIWYLRMENEGWLIWFWHPQARIKKNLLCFALSDAIRFIERKHGPRK